MFVVAYMCACFGSHMLRDAVSSKHSMCLGAAEEMTGQGSGNSGGWGFSGANAHEILSGSPGRQGKQEARLGKRKFGVSRETPVISCYQEVRPQVPNHCVFSGKLKWA